MLELESAQLQILAAIPSPISETVPLASALDRFLVSPVSARVSLPPFDNSAMDGYAVRAADVKTATEKLPVRLRLAGRVAAGETFSGKLKDGECIRIFTGSPLPEGADAVVMQEDSSVESGSPEFVSIRDATRPWENVRFRGEDVREGAVAAREGERIGTGRQAFLAAAGCDRAEVGKRPVVGLLATGSELQEPGAGNELGPGQIIETNRGMLAALVQKAGGVPVVYPAVPDDLESTREKLAEAFSRCDLIITSGGVSVGEMDFVKKAFEEIGGALEFWKVAIRPGRPFVFGRIDRKLLFGLPGNPVSALVTFLLLARPAILKWQGARDIFLPAHPARLAEDVGNTGTRRHFMRVLVGTDGQVRSTGAQASHLLSSVAASNALLDVPPQTSISAGEIVQVLRWDF